MVVTRLDDAIPRDERVRGELQVRVFVVVQRDVLIVAIRGEERRIDGPPIAGAFVEGTRKRDAHGLPFHRLSVDPHVLLGGKHFDDNRHGCLSVTGFDDSIPRSERILGLLVHVGRVWTEVHQLVHGTSREVIQFRRFVPRVCLLGGHFRFEGLDAFVFSLGGQLGGGAERLDSVPRDTCHLVSDMFQVTAVDDVAGESDIGAGLEDVRELVDEVAVQRDLPGADVAVALSGRPGEPLLRVVGDHDCREQVDIAEQREGLGVGETVGFVKNDDHRAVDGIG